MPEIRSLTAIRGVAALWIVLHHFWPQTEGLVPHIIAKGYLAVDLFFILSGLVLFLVYQSELRTGCFNFQSFAIKRFARLYPLHFATLVLAIVILTGGPQIGLSGREIPYDLSQMIFLHVTLLHAWGITETGGLNYPSWSLSAEAFAYVLFPLLALLVLRTRFAILSSVICLIALVASLELFWPIALRNPMDTLLFSRLENDFGILRIVPEFTLGIAIAKGRTFRQPTWLWIAVGIAMIAAGLMVNLDLITIIGFAALLAGCIAQNPSVGWLFHKAGVLSYSIYMCHALVQIVGFKMIEWYFEFDDRAVPTVFILPLFGITILCALMLHYGVERPARRWILSLSKIKSAGLKVPRSSPM